MLRTQVDTDADRRVNDLLKQIIANPADDTLRLVYADALQDRGDGDDELWACTIRHSIKAKAGRMLETLYWDGGFEKEVWATIRALREKPVFRTKRQQYLPFRSWAHWDRGFVDKVYCDNLDEWKEIAPHLYWHADQTEECDEWAEGGDPDDHGKTGLFLHRRTRPRPCPATAHPVQYVKLSTRPEVRYWGAGRSRGSRCYYLGTLEDQIDAPDVEVPEATDSDPVLRLVLDKYWPTVTFEFPDR